MTGARLAMLVLFVAACSSADRAESPTTRVTDTQKDSATTVTTWVPVSTVPPDQLPAARLVRRVGLRGVDGFCVVSGEAEAEGFRVRGWTDDSRCIGAEPTVGAAR